MFFFFKQKTAYEMRISDWSSDVCSSDLQVLAIDLHFGARPLAEQNAVARLHVQRGHLAIFAARARAYGDDFAFLRLFLRGIGNDDAACGLLFGFDPADENTVMQRTKSHASPFLNQQTATSPIGNPYGSAACPHMLVSTQS